jgi:glycosidase
MTTSRTLVYQVFVDRFAGDDGRPLAPPPPGADPWQHHAGGTLDGIAARLDHIVGLGADALYLTPIFRAGSNHKYDTHDFESVDERFGGDAAFARLALACRERGVGLILDGVFNHVSDRHPWFTEARADGGGARSRWFRFERHPDRYAAWRGHGALPELALEHEAVGAALLDGPDAVLRRWLRRGATGFRLDCANDLGFAACARAARAAGEEGAPDGVIGEVMAWAEEWVAEGRLDAVMNYWVRETVLGLARGDIAVPQAAHNLALMAARWRPRALLRSWNLLASHDTARLASALPDAAARAFARALAFLLPGVPHVYYGDEVGLAGAGDPENRGVMVWDEAAWEKDTLAQVRALAGLRRERLALRAGTYVPMDQPGTPALVFARDIGRPEELCVVVANASARPLAARVFLPHSFLLDALPLVDARGVAPQVKVCSGRVDIELPAWGVACYVPRDGAIEGYRFFGRC